MKQILKLEEIALFILCAIMFDALGLNNLWFWVFLLAPDISALGYLAGNKIGAICYNFFHHKALAIAVLIVGWFGNDVTIMGVGLVLLAHSSMDRVFGYGLKYFSGFKDTHLGKIGNNNKT